MMTPAEQREFAALKTQVETLLSRVAAAGEYAGVDLTVSPEPPMGQLLAFPAGGRGDRKRVAGGAASQVTMLAASRRVSTPGVAS